MTARKVVLLAAGAAVVLFLSCGPVPYIVEAKWSRALHGSTSGPPAIGPDGTIYAAGGGMLMAFSTDGATKWSLPASHLCSPVIGEDGTIYLLTQDPVNYTVGLCAIDPAGSTRWRRMVLPTFTPFHGLAIGRDGVICCAVDTFLIAVEANSALRWQVSLGEGVSCPPVIGLGGTIYVCSHYSVSAVSSAGNLMWRVVVPNYFGEVPPVVAPDGRIYCVDNSGELFALDASGQERWRHRGSLPVVGADSVVRFFAGHENLWELPPNGALRSRRTASAGQCAVTDDGRIYCAISGDEFLSDDDARLDALNPDGSLLWTFKAAGDHYSAWPPVVGPDGTVYLATSFNLYAVTDSGSCAGCWWPMYQHDARHTGQAAQP
jgi:outer membrane protein assembly factor BamB